jgi:hypothetical protein
MKPFDLEKAKNGHPVCTRDGRDARIICFDKKGDRPILALVDDEIEYLFSYNGDGFYFDCVSSRHDLLMRTSKTTYYTNVYRNSNGNIFTGYGRFTMQQTEWELSEHKRFNADGEFIKTISFEIEE